MKIGGYRLIPIFGNTKKWVKQDIKTIKRSAIKTLKVMPLIIVISFFLSAAVDYLLAKQFNIAEIFIYFIIMTPYAILGFFLVHVMKTKGYDIGTP